MKLLIIVFILFSANAISNVFQVQDGDASFPRAEFTMSDFVKDYAKYKKLNVIFTNDFKDQTIHLVGLKRMGVEKLNLYLTLVLYQKQYSMFVIPETNTLKIIPARDTRYRTATAYTDLSKTPNTYENILFTYKLEHVPANGVARNLRPLASRYGRIIDHTGDGILISDTAKNVRRMMEVVLAMDTSEQAKAIASIKELNEKNKKIITKKKEFLEIVGDNNIIFIVLFSLIGLIIGFGTRGYLMKRIEGGW